MILILCVQNLSAQTDTLNMSYWVDRYKKAETEADIMKSSYHIAQLSGNNDTIILFSQKAQRLAEKLGHKEIETNSRIIIGKIYGIKHEYENGIEILNKALTLSENYNLPLMSARAHYELGN